MKVAIFGGAFDPPHMGHIEICRWALEELGLDAVWVIPCFLHPFGKNMTAFEDRLAMCQLAFSSFGKSVVVSDVEQKLGGISVTRRTLEHLLKKNPDTQFSLLLGEDIKNEKHRWKDFAVIEKLASVVFIPRGKHSPIPDVSATCIREQLAAGKSVAEEIPAAVLAYIQSKKIY